MLVYMLCLDSNDLFSIVFEFGTDIYTLSRDHSHVFALEVVAMSTKMFIVNIFGVILYY